MSNISFINRAIAEELEDTLNFGNLSDNWGKIREKAVDHKNKPYYSLLFKFGEILVYSPQQIIIKLSTREIVCKSSYQTKRTLIDLFVQ